MQRSRKFTIHSKHKKAFCGRSYQFIIMQKVMNILFLTWKLHLMGKWSFLRPLVFTLWLSCQSEFVTFYENNWMENSRQTKNDLFGLSEWMYTLTVSKSIRFHSINPFQPILKSTAQIFRATKNKLDPSGSEVIIYVRINCSCTLLTTYFSSNYFEVPFWLNISFQSIVFCWADTIIIMIFNPIKRCQSSVSEEIALIECNIFNIK